MADLKEFAEQLVNLTVKEVNDLAAILKDEYGIEPAAAAVAVAAGPAGGDGGGEAAEEKSEFDILLNSAGSAKLAVVKEVKNLLGVGLKDAKDLVDGAPSVIKEGVAKAEAESIKSALEAAGATVELK
jgi:large subunit ribosomal protein L7/L12